MHLLEEELPPAFLPWKKPLPPAGHSHSSESHLFLYHSSGYDNVNVRLRVCGPMSLWLFSNSPLSSRRAPGVPCPYTDVFSGVCHARDSAAAVLCTAHCALFCSLPLGTHHCAPKPQLCTGTAKLSSVPICLVANRIISETLNPQSKARLTCCVLLLTVMWNQTLKTTLPQSLIKGELPHG